MKSPENSWLSPVSEAQGCGPDLEYDPESLELIQAAGTPGSQFGPGEPANWARVGELAEALLSRTRDLRVALWWGRARLNLDGFAALPGALALICGLLDKFWDELHPLPDADDPEALARLSVIGGLDKLDSLLGDVRNSELSSDPRVNGLRVRDVEVALSKVSPRPDEAPLTQGQIAGMFAAVPDASANLRAQCEAALASLTQLQSVLNQRFSADKAVDLRTVRAMVTGIQSLLPAPEAVAPVEPQGNQSGPVATTSRVANGVYSVQTRHDAVRAIELVCAYLELNEPTNPAQLLLRRAARVIDKNFLELVQELAPDAVKDVARIMGVDAASIQDQN